MIFLTVSQTQSWCKGDRVGWQACMRVSVYGYDLAKWCLRYIYSANEETENDLLCSKQEVNRYFQP